MRRIFLAVVISSALSGCASLNSVSVTSIPANRSNTVTAQSDKWVIFGFNFNNDYADRVAKELESKCPGGKVSGILTKDEVYNYFLFIVMKRNIEATGYCETKDKVASAGSRKARKVNSVDESEASEEGSEQ